MRTQATGNLIGFARDEEVETVVLSTQLVVQPILEASQGGILVAGDRHGGGLVAGGVDFDLMLERVIIEVVYVNVPSDQLRSCI